MLTFHVYEIITSVLVLISSCKFLLGSTSSYLTLPTTFPIHLQRLYHILSSFLFFFLHLFSLYITVHPAGSSKNIKCLPMVLCPHYPEPDLVITQANSMCCGGPASFQTWQNV